MLTAADVERKFRLLRERYCREKFKLEVATKSGAGRVKFEPWHLFEAMRFLDPVQMKRLLVFFMEIFNNIYK